MSPGGTDAAVVERHLMALNRCVHHLRQHQDCTATELGEDVSLRWTVERGLQICAQNALDIASHLAAAAGLDTPDYASAINRLCELDILPAQFADEFRGIAGFRNVLVHGYLDVDLDILHKTSTRGLDEFDVFAEYIEHYLDKVR